MQLLFNNSYLIIIIVVIVNKNRGKLNDENI